MRFLLTRPRSELAIYRPDIDGLRALAVLPVVFFHAGFRLFPGGFVGVDIFFVISGYLITAIVARQVAEGRFSFAAFYERRVRRILPALFFLALVVTLVAAVLFPPTDFAAYGRSLLALALFASNFHFLGSSTGDGYFDIKSQTQALLHSWSLSLEEQFYIVLPISLVLIDRWARGWLKPALIAATIASFLLSLVCGPLAGFYLLPPRAWELLIGGLLALGLFPPLGRRAFREAAGLAGIGLIAAAVLLYDKNTPFPGLAALAPCLGAWLVLYAGNDGDCTVKRALGLRPLVVIGLLSYSLYLWHWPIVVFLQYSQAEGFGRAEKAAVVVASFAAAFVSYRWIELPFRRQGNGWSRAGIFRLGALASVLTLVVGAAILGLQGVPQRFDAVTQAIIAANQARKLEQGTLGERHCTFWKRAVSDASQVAICPIGPDRPRKILFWGDSHVEMLQDSIDRLFASGAFGDRGVLYSISEGCVPTRTITTLQPNTGCANFARLVLERASQPDIDMVFLAFSTWWQIGEVSFCVLADGRCLRSTSSRSEIEKLFLADLDQEIRSLKAAGKTVIVSLPFPQYNHNIPDLEIRNAMFGRYIGNMQAHPVDSPAFSAQIRDVVLAAGGIVYDPRRSLCPDGACIYERGGISIYHDTHHVAISQTGILDAGLAAVFRPGP